MTSASEAATDRELPAVEYGLIRAHVLASLVTLLISASFGIIVATKLTLPEFLGGHGWLTWGRLRYDHTQGIFFGWLGNAFLAFSYYAVPRLANRAVSSRKLGWLLFGLWNFAVVLPGWVLVAAGFSQPLEWAEFPLVVDADTGNVIGGAPTCLIRNGPLPNLRTASSAADSKESKAPMS